MEYFSGDKEIEEDRVSDREYERKNIEIDRGEYAIYDEKYLRRFCPKKIFFYVAKGFIVVGVHNMQ